MSDTKTKIESKKHKSKFEETKAKQIITTVMRAHQAYAIFKRSFNVDILQASKNNFIALKKDVGVLAPEEKFLFEFIKNNIIFSHGTPCLEEMTIKSKPDEKIITARLSTLRSRQLSSQNVDRNRHTIASCGLDRNCFATVEIRGTTRTPLFLGKEIDIIQIDPILYKKNHSISALDFAWIAPHLDEYIAGTYIPPRRFKASDGSYTEYSFHLIKEGKFTVFTYKYPDGSILEITNSFSEQIYAGQHLLSAIALQLIQHLRRMKNDFIKNLIEKIQKLDLSNENDSKKAKNEIAEVMFYLMPTTIYPELKIPGNLEFQYVKQDLQSCLKHESDDTCQFTKGVRILWNRTKELCEQGKLFLNYVNSSCDDSFQRKELNNNYEKENKIFEQYEQLEQLIIAIRFLKLNRLKGIEKTIGLRKIIAQYESKYNRSCLNELCDIRVYTNIPIENGEYVMIPYGVPEQIAFENEIDLLASKKLVLEDRLQKKQYMPINRDESKLISLEIAKLLLQNGAKLIYSQAEYRESPLFVAIETRNYELIEYVLQQEEISTINNSLSIKVDINCTSIFLLDEKLMYNPILHAITMLDPHIIGILNRFGANFKYRELQVFILLGHMAYTSNKQKIEKFVKIIKLLCNDYGLSKRDILIIAAAKKNNFLLVQELLKIGFSIDAKQDCIGFRNHYTDDYGFNLLHYASNNGNLEMFKLIVEFKVEQLNSLSSITTREDKEIKLVNFLNQKTPSGQTAYSIAENKGHQEIVDYLIRYNVEQSSTKYSPAKYFTMQAIAVVTGTINGKDIVILGKKWNKEGGIKEQYLFPGGIQTPADITPEVAAARELEEETNFPIHRLIQEHKVETTIIANIKHQQKETILDRTFVHFKINDDLSRFKLFPQDDLSYVCMLPISSVLYRASDSENFSRNLSAREKDVAVQQYIHTYTVKDSESNSSQEIPILRSNGLILDLLFNISIQDKEKLQEELQQTNIIEYFGSQILLQHVINRQHKGARQLCYKGFSFNITNNENMPAFNIACQQGDLEMLELMAISENGSILFHPDLLIHIWSSYDSKEEKINFQKGIKLWNKLHDLQAQRLLNIRDCCYARLIYFAVEQKNIEILRLCLTEKEEFAIFSRVIGKQDLITHICRYGNVDILRLVIPTFLKRLETDTNASTAEEKQKCSLQLRKTLNEYNIREIKWRPPFFASVENRNWELAKELLDCKKYPFIDVNSIPITKNNSERYMQCAFMAQKSIEGSCCSDWIMDNISFRYKSTIPFVMAILADQFSLAKGISEHETFQIECCFEELSSFFDADLLEKDPKIYTNSNSQNLQEYFINFKNNIYQISKDTVDFLNEFIKRNTEQYMQYKQGETTKLMLENDEYLKRDPKGYLKKPTY